MKNTTQLIIIAIVWLLILTGAGYIADQFGHDLISFWIGVAAFLSSSLIGLFLIARLQDIDNRKRNARH